jgi:hypothetical protein
MLPYKQTEVNEFLQRKETMEMPTFKTIRQTAALGILTEHRLRLMVAQGSCPGIRTGNRFLVNVDALVELLDKQSRVEVKEQ